MAIAHVSSVRGAGTGFVSTITLSLDAGTADNRAIVLFTTVGSVNTSYATAATYGGVSMTAGTAFLNTAANRQCRAFWLTGASVPSGTNNIVVTYLNADGRPEINAHSFTGVGAISGETTGQGSAASSGSITITSTVDDIGVIALFHDGATGSVTPGTGVTETLDLFGTNYCHWGGYKAGASSLNMAFTFPGNRVWSGVGLSLETATSDPTIVDIAPTENTAEITYTGVATHYRLNGGSGIAIGASPATITGLTANTEYTIELSPDNSTWYSSTDFGTENPAGMGSGIAGGGAQHRIGVSVGVGFF